MAWATTVDSPTKSAPPKPPTRASTSESQRFVDAPIAARAAPVRIKPNEQGLALVRPAREAQERDRPEQGAEADRGQDAAERAGAGVRLSRTSAGTMYATGGAAKSPAMSSRKIIAPRLRWPKT